MTPEHTPKRSPAQRARRAKLRADGTPARVTRRRPETRGRLLDAAFGVFAARGFGAFYSNFDTLDELFFALYTERSELIADQVAAGLTLPPSDIPGLVAQAVQALMVDRDWILVSTDFRLYAARNPEVAAALRVHRNKLRDALAASLTPAIDRSGLPASLQTPDGLARAVMAIHDGATTELLLDNDPARFRSWLADLLTALLEHPA
jgi:AcrR family transcriptional regulator